MDFWEKNGIGIEIPENEVLQRIYRDEYNNIRVEKIEKRRIKKEIHEEEWIDHNQYEYKLILNNINEYHDELFREEEHKRNKTHMYMKQVFMGVNREFFPVPDYRFIPEEYKNEWRDQLLEDYNHECYLCGEEEYLEAHHLNNRSDHPDEIFDPENGIILCEECHHKFHSWMGGFREKCTKEDFQRYLEE